MEKAKDEARIALRVERRLKPSEPDNFGILASDSVLGIFQQATAGIAVVLVGIVGLSLLVGGIVIMNIMLMVVSERTREIGLRKALGAKRRDIMSQVLTESITLSLFGGVMGVALGAMFSTTSRRSRRCRRLSSYGQSSWAWHHRRGGADLRVLPGAASGMLDPIEALRRE